MHKTGRSGLYSSGGSWIIVCEQPPDKWEKIKWEGKATLAEWDFPPPDRSRLILPSCFFLPLYHNWEPVHRPSRQGSFIQSEKMSTPPLPCFGLLQKKYTHTP